MCILCQEQKNEKLQCPSNSKRSDVGEGYRRMAENMEGFFDINRIPFDVQKSQLDDGSGMYNTLLKNKSSWHVSCKDKINATKLQRAQKGKSSSEVYSSFSPKKTRGASFCGLGQIDNESRCFFCNDVE